MSKKKIIKNTGLIILTLLVLMIMSGVRYLDKYFKITDIEVLLFHFSQPLAGSDPLLVRRFLSFFFVHPPVVLSLMLVCLGGFFYIKNKFFNQQKDYRFSITTKMLFANFLVVFALMFFYVGNALNVVDYLKRAKQKPTLFYEEKYIYPEETEIKFPSEKKNLIIIYLESLEKTYFKRPLFTNDLLSNIEKLTKDEISFGGFKQLSGSFWTIGGIFSSFCGVPLKTTRMSEMLNMDNRINAKYGSYKYFFRNIKCLPEILKENGYRNYYIQGAFLAYSGKDKFLTQHGMDEMYGRKHLEAYYNYEEKYKGHWGINDYGMYQFAKEKLLEIAKNDDLFSLTMLTVDPHGPDGFLSPKCAIEYETEFENILHCSDKILFDFLTWAKAQDFYQDTRIVIMGDHLSQVNPLYETLIQSNNRQTVNLFLNHPNKNTSNVEQNKSYAAIDMFPTILEYLDADIQGDRLGLGTSLFSKKKTLLEELGFEVLNTNIYANSELYESFR